MLFQQRTHPPDHVQVRHQLGFQLSERIWGEIGDGHGKSFIPLNDSSIEMIFSLEFGTEITQA
jgi:hypothetical protein